MFSLCPMAQYNTVKRRPVNRLPTVISATRQSSWDWFTVYHIRTSHPRHGELNSHFSYDILFFLGKNIHFLGELICCEDKLFLLTRPNEAWLEKFGKSVQLGWKAAVSKVKADFYSGPLTCLLADTTVLCNAHELRLTWSEIIVCEIFQL